jgi:hypothetical protein
MEDESPRTDRGLAELRLSLSRIALEIVVGFVGVYAAFALTAYHERQQVDERRRQITQALITEITYLTDLSHHNIAGYRVQLAAFEADVKAGKKPIPTAYTEPVGLNMHIWDATKQSGGLNLLDVATFSRIGNFYNSISEMLAYYAQLRDLSVNVILPNADRGPDAFYNAKTGALRSDIRLLYHRDLTFLGNVSETAARQGDGLLVRLKHAAQ